MVAMEALLREFTSRLEGLMIYHTGKHLKKSNFSILIKTHFLGDIGRYLILQMCCRTISTYCQPHDF